MTRDEEQAFARFLRQRLPEDGLYTLTRYAAQVLRDPTLLHWRGLSREDAQTVMQACRRDHPHVWRE
ncbi:hypothetical protein [Deinococcus sp. 6GRE01]|uniref:hypothetical protein n=1 Tax=Deinococcus sp. 6GRE01 TaxID=2745873 RepID=UPI001E51BFE7|nr:hypothetical protein [Deinococcus sp. 6GRE01]MCD0155963.1 hypothetical protein [Deinococcus sp. 6GRE01]